jgi:glucose-1-phosphate cytidylyltransferase
MKAVILAGGLGERLKKGLRHYGSNVRVEPKPLVEVNGIPLIRHVIEQIVSTSDIREFVVATGYLGDNISTYFNEVRQELSKFNVNIKVIDTGVESQKAGRLLKLKEIGCFNDGEDFLLSNADDLYDINVSEIINFHKNHNDLLTIVTSPWKADFGEIEYDKSSMKIINMVEKGERVVNTGLMILDPRVLEYAKPELNMECDVYPHVVRLGKASCYHHNGRWMSANNVEELRLVEVALNENKINMKKLTI